VRNRQLTFQIDPEAQARLESHLRLKAPVTVRVVSERSGRLHGEYDPNTRTVYLYLGADLFTNSRLLHVKQRIIQTLLHEFRHAHQFDHWPAERMHRDSLRQYGAQEREKDARDFQANSMAEWMSLGVLKVKNPASPLRRLSRAERSIA